MPSSAQLTKPLVLHVQGSSRVEMPRLIYGTAWKKDQTANLVYQALRAGFRGIDTAAQPRHYREDLVGEGIRRAVSEGIVTRESLFIQTKFTAVSGQDPGSMPYDAHAGVPDQVHASIRSSLRNLHTPDVEAPYLDSVVLHSPYRNSADTLAAWDALRTHVPHAIRSIGISNTTVGAVKLLGEAGALPPAVVQNRFHELTGYDAELRAHCRRTGITYQSFWTLSANPALLRGAPVARLVESVEGLSPAGALYCLVLGLGGTAVLDGTCSATHMREDLEAVGKVERWAAGAGELWDTLVAEFKESIGDTMSEYI